MTDTIRTTAALQTLFADNSSGSITAQSLRDFTVSAILTPPPGSGLNQSGSNLTISGGQSTGSGSGGSIILQTSSPAASGSGLNVYAPAITIDSSQVVTFGANILTNQIIQGGAVKYNTNGDGQLLISNNGLTGFTSLTYGGANVTTGFNVTQTVYPIPTSQTNTASGNFTYQVGQSTGNVSSGSHIFQVTPAGTSGTTQNAYVTALTIYGSGNATFGLSGTASTPAMTFTGSAYSGTGTTSKALLLLEPTGTTAGTTWNTSGTILGINTPASFAAGNALMIKQDGRTVATINAQGTITCQNIQPAASLTFTSNSSSIQLRAGGTNITSPASNTLQFGQADAASPVAQTISVTSVVAGTTNTAGTDFTIKGSVGTGTGAGGSIIFQTAAAGTTGSSQNTLATALTIDSTKLATFGGGVTVPTTIQGSVSFAPMMNMGVSVAGLVKFSRIDATSTYMASIGNSGGTSGISVNSIGVYAWSSSSSDSGNIFSGDTFIGRASAANIRLGNVDVASPVAQTLSMQNVVTGTTNTAGRDFTIIASKPTGSAEPGKIILSFYGNGSSGSTVATTNYLWQYTRNALTGPAQYTIGNGSYSQFLNGNASVTTATTGNNNSCHSFVSSSQTQSNGSDHEDFKHTATFAPTSGASPFYGMVLDYTINQTGTSSGGYTALKVNVTETAVLGSTKNLIDLQTGGLSKFSVNSTGGTTIAGGTNILGNNTIQGQISQTYAATASTSVQKMSGALLTGGTGTTTFPQFRQETVNPTAVTTWSTSGTYWGVNADSGFVGNFLDFRVNGGVAIFQVSPTTFTSALAHSFSSQTTFSYAGGASLTPLILTGALYTSGTATTNFPQLFQQPTGTTAVTTWSTNGTWWGVNSASGFSGNFIDFHLGGAASVFKVDNFGSLTTTGNITTAARIANSYGGTASNPPMIFQGNLYAAGDGTTTFPQFLQQPTGTTAVTTWSTSGTFWGVNAASGFAGNFLDFHVAGGSSLVSINSAGTVNAVNFNCTTTGVLAYGSRSKIGTPVDSAVSFSNSAATQTTYISVPANAQLQLGSIDAASPVAQTLLTQSVVTGTSNTAGVNLTICGSKGTGTGVGGSIIFQVAPASTTGSTPNALVTALTIDSTKTATLNSDGILNTSTDTLLLSNSTASTVSNTVQQPGRIRFYGSAWKSSATAASQTQEWLIEMVPATGTGSTSSSLGFKSSNNGAAYVTQLLLSTSVQTFTGNVTLSTGGALLTIGGSSGPILRSPNIASGAMAWGAADAAAPVAQSQQVQSVVAGTSNTAGVDWTFKGSIGTGTGAGGSIIFQTAAAGSTGSSQNTLATALTIDSTKTATFAGDVVHPTKTPSSASDTGTTGTIAWDSSFVYVCTAINTWKRVAIATW